MMWAGNTIKQKLLMSPQNRYNFRSLCYWKSLSVWMNPKPIRSSGWPFCNYSFFAAHLKRGLCLLCLYFKCASFESQTENIIRKSILQLLAGIVHSSFSFITMCLMLNTLVIFISLFNEASHQMELFSRIVIRNRPLLPFLFKACYPTPLWGKGYC